MKKLLLLGFTTCLILILASSAWAGACHVITPAGSGNKSGSDWNNACAGFSGNCSASSGMVRGDSYYVAAGSYTTPFLSRATSSTSVISILSPTASDHCTDTGFNAGTMVGAANMSGQMQVSTDYWTVNGQYGTALNKGSYGIKITDTKAADFIIQANANNLTFSYLEIQGDNAGSSCSGGDVGIFFGQSGSGYSNVTADHVYIYKTNNHFKINNMTNVTIQYGAFTENYSGSSCHGENIAENSATNTVVRYNYFENCRGTACVAAGACSYCGVNQNSAYYGNTFNFTSDFASLDPDPLSNGIFHTLGGSGWNNALIYNNTVANCTNADGGGCGTFTDSGSGTNTNMTVRNTLFYNNSASMGITAATCSNNSYWSQTRVTSCTNDQTGQSGSPFVNASITQGQTPDFHLSSDTASWFSLSSPYDVDPDGTPRTSSRGAYQYGGGSSQNPNPPTGLSALVQ